MRGLEKNRMKRDKYANTQTNTQTSRLYDRIGPVGRFDENGTILTTITTTTTIPTRKNQHPQPPMAAKKKSHSLVKISLEVRKLLQNLFFFFGKTDFTHTFTFQTCFQRIGPWPILSKSRNVSLFIYVFVSRPLFM